MERSMGWRRRSPAGPGGCVPVPGSPGREGQQAAEFTTDRADSDMPRMGRERARRKPGGGPHRGDALARRWGPNGEARAHAIRGFSQPAAASPATARDLAGSGSCWWRRLREGGSGGRPPGEAGRQSPGVGGRGGPGWRHPRSRSGVREDFAATEKTRLGLPGGLVYRNSSGLITGTRRARCWSASASTARWCTPTVPRRTVVVKMSSGRTRSKRLLWTRCELAPREAGVSRGMGL